MKDNCYIDNVSTCNQFGVWVTRGGYSDLLAFPAMRDPDYTDWPEHDGIEVDLSAPRLEEKTVDITFFASDQFRKMDFIGGLAADGYRTLSIPALNRTWQLRLADHPANRHYNTASEFTLRFIEDNPVRPINSDLPDPGLQVVSSAYELDGINIADYGVIVQSARESVMKSAAAKTNLTRKISTVDGQVYDTTDLKYKQKEVSFKCLLKAATIANMWQCYDAFLEALIQPEERQLYIEYLEDMYSCYYKKTSSWRVLSIAAPLMEFTLTLVFTDFRIDSVEFLLATEQNELIITESDDYCIDLK